MKNRYVSKETWYDKDGKPFQPGVHYFVGGATKMYGAALFRLRQARFRRAHRTADGMSPDWPIGYEDLEPYYTQAEQMYQSTARAAKIPPIRRPALPIRFRRSATNRASRKSPMTWSVRVIIPPMPHAASCSTKRNRAEQRLHSLRSCDGYPASSTPRRTPRSRGSSGLAVSERDDGDQRPRAAAQHQPQRTRGHRGDGRTPRPEQETQAASSSCPPARPTRPSCS